MLCLSHADDHVLAHYDLLVPMNEGMPDHCPRGATHAQPPEASGRQLRAEATSFLPMAGREGGGEPRSESPASLLPSPMPDVGIPPSSEPGSSSQPQKGGNRGVRVQPPGTSTAPRPNYYDVLTEGVLPSSAPEAGMLLPSSELVVGMLPSFM